MTSFWNVSPEHKQSHSSYDEEVKPPSQEAKPVSIPEIQNFHSVSAEPSTYRGSHFPTSSLRDTDRLESEYAPRAAPVLALPKLPVPQYGNETTRFCEISQSHLTGRRSSQSSDHKLFNSSFQPNFASQIR